MTDHSMLSAILSGKVIKSVIFKETYDEDDTIVISFSDGSVFEIIAKGCPNGTAYLEVDHR
jgi:hypothetical protein